MSVVVQRDGGSNRPANGRTACPKQPWGCDAVVFRALWRDEARWQGLFCELVSKQALPRG